MALLFRPRNMMPCGHMLYWHRHVFCYRMRRVLVIFLILLFPLNVLALSLSVSTAGGAEAALAAPSMPGADAVPGADIASSADLDPDEPPPGMDLHDIVNIEAGLRLATLQDAAAPPRDARRPCHAISPPLRPPRAA